MDPLVKMKVREQWFWCPEFASSTNLDICQDRVRRHRPYYPCNSCTRWKRKAEAAGLKLPLVPRTVAKAG